MASKDLYTALREIGVGEDKALAVVVGFEERFNRIESDLKLLKWMVGTNVILTIGVLFKLLT
jgi:hypothetical protein